MPIYLAKWHDGRIGKASNAMAAINKAIGTKEFQKFNHDTPVKGYQWSAYQAREGKYETCTINHNGHQLCQIFRGDVKHINELEFKFYHKGESK